MFSPHQAQTKGQTAPVGKAGASRFYTLMRKDPRAAAMLMGGAGAGAATDMLWLLTNSPKANMKLAYNAHQPETGDHWGHWIG